MNNPMHRAQCITGPRDGPNTRLSALTGLLSFVPSYNSR